MKFFDIKRVEEIIDYKFKNKKHLEEALTHSSMGTGFTSYQRFEFLGDAVIDLAVSKHFFLAEPHLGPGELTSVRSANVSNHKLARVAARLGLYHHVRGNNLDYLDVEVEKFEEAVREEEDWLVYGGVKAPKILADIVESIAAAIYVDLDFDMEMLCPILERCLLKPIVTLEDLKNHSQPIRELYELCQKQGKQIDIKCERDGSKNNFNASVYIDEELVASESCKLKKYARINAAMAALSKQPKQKTPAIDGGDRLSENVIDVILEYLKNHPQPINELYELCQKQGKQIEIKCERDGSKNDFNASVYIDEELVASESSKLKKNAMTNAAMAALSKLPKQKTPATDGGDRLSKNVIDITLEYLKNHPQPINELYELCQKQGKQIEIKCERDGSKYDFNASVYIDEELVASESSKLKKNARTNAAMAALSKLP